jgi:D-beta-D-heptose 7-phosphate kinase/D-beta-D-heptose 1-phosphate adenosyltransferase
VSVIRFSEERLHQVLESFSGKRVAVLGDLMLDRYYWGTVRRISPEAPVPVVEVDTESVRFGGAANVAQNIRSLGGIPMLVGLIGNDHPGKMFLDMMQEVGYETDGIVTDADRQTTIKTRVIAHGQHVVRIDNETRTRCPEHLFHRLIDSIKYKIHSIDAILIEDYNKGVVSVEIIREVMAVAGKHGKIVTVDPKFDNFFEYKGVTVFKPNRREAEEAIGGRIRTVQEVERAGKQLLELLSAENVLLTRGEEGMSLFERNGGIMHIPTVADHVQDVSGAGDTVISTLTVALSAGVPIREACVLANCAGGVVVGSVGIVPVSPDDLIKAALRHSNNSPAGD